MQRSMIFLVLSFCGFLSGMDKSPTSLKVGTTLRKKYLAGGPEVKNDSPKVAFEDKTEDQKEEDAYMSDSSQDSLASNFSTRAHRSRSQAAVPAIKNEDNEPAEESEDC